jgi:hypothetical protein
MGLTVLKRLYPLRLYTLQLHAKLYGQQSLSLFFFLSFFLLIDYCISNFPEPNFIFYEITFKIENHIHTLITFVLNTFVHL